MQNVKETQTFRRKPEGNPCKTSGKPKPLDGNPRETPAKREGNPNFYKLSEGNPWETPIRKCRFTLWKLQRFLCRGKGVQKLSWDACAKKLYSLQYYTSAGFQRVCTNKQRDNRLFIRSDAASLTLRCGGEPLPHSILQWLEDNLIVSMCIYACVCVCVCLLLLRFDAAGESKQSQPSDISP